MNTYTELTALLNTIATLARNEGDDKSAANRAELQFNIAAYERAYANLSPKQQDVLDAYAARIAEEN